MFTMCIDHTVGIFQCFIETLCLNKTLIHKSELFLMCF
jgi:hypothetical protein